MHAENLSYSVELEIQNQFNISCRLVMSVQVLHAVKYPTLGIVQSIGGKFLKNGGLIPQDLCKGIWVQVEA